MKYAESPRLLAALGPQPLWIHYKCVPVWDDLETLHIIGWEQVSEPKLEDLSLIFGKFVKQTGTATREELETLIRTHAADQPISDLI